jgi:hypothetical protein
MTFTHIVSTTLALVLLAAVPTRAELHHAEIKTLGMD